MGARQAGRKGFTLVEVLVAFMILAFSLGALVSLFSGSLRAVRQGEDYSRALAVAQTRMALLDGGGVDGPGVETGETDDGYRWRVEMEPLDLPGDDGKGPARPLRLTVTVSWGALDQRRLTLSSARLVVK